MILGLFLSMIIFLLEPFDTNTFQSEYRTWLLLGFGILFTVVYFLYGFLEAFGFNLVKKDWKVRHELVSVLFFFLVSGTIIFLYNNTVINESSYDLRAHLGYLIYIVTPMMLILSPFLLFFRQKFGTWYAPVKSEMIQILGKNQKERLSILKENLLYIQAEENYISIYYLDADFGSRSKTFRQTLSSVHLQASFLEKCHRSYLVNPELIQEVAGNSQNAKIVLKNCGLFIPLSKTYYKTFKDNLSEVL